MTEEGKGGVFRMSIIGELDNSRSCFIPSEILKLLLPFRRYISISLIESVV